MRKLQAVDRSVKSFGPDGGLRSRRFSQADAQWLATRGLAFVTKWNRERSKILCIQFFDESGILTKPQRWLKTGTRYSYPEMIADHAVWTHKPLPYRMIRAELEFAAIAEVNQALQSLFAGPALSTVPKRKAKVISISSARRHSAPGTLAPERIAA